MKKHLTLIILTFSSICAFAQVPNYVPTNGLVGYWPFNGNANDESGNNNNGTVNGATLTTDRFGVTNKAYSFISNDILISNLFFDNGWNDYSISLWFTTNNISQYMQNFFNTFPHDGEGLGWNHANVPAKISHWKNSDPNQHVWDVFSANPLNFSNVQNNEWNNIIIVKTGLVYNYYVNGQLDKTSIATISAISSFTGIRLGSIGSAEFLNGKLDDFGIWNRGLTQCEIADLYYSQLGSLNSTSTLTETALDSYTLNGQTYTQSGIYTQVIPNAAGCDSTITLNLSLDFTGVSELNKEFSIAPNPATDQLTISTNTLSNEKYILFDPQGRQVLSGSLTGTTTQLDLSKLAIGNYLLQIGEKLTPVKLVKE